MSYEEKAKVILEELDEVVQINWNLREVYEKAIVKGLKKISIFEAGDKESEIISEKLKAEFKKEE